MKPIFAFLLTGTLLAATPVMLAQDKFDTSKGNTKTEAAKIIRTQLEYIVIPTATATKMMYGEKKSANDSELREQLQNLLDEGKASMLDSQMVTAISGNKATTESIREFIYPTEYEPSEIPSEVHIDGTKKIDSAKHEIITAPNPTSFETRNTGFTLELEATINDGKSTIDLRLAPEIVYHVGEQVWAEFRDQLRNADIKMPIFYTLRINTGVTVEAGKYHLVAMLSPKTEEGFSDNSHKIFVFVKSDILDVSR